MALAIWIRRSARITCAVSARQPLEFIGQVAKDRRRRLGSVLGHESQQEAPTGLLQFRGRLQAGIVRRPAALVAADLCRKRPESEAEAARGCL
jgi:hypothetical protein